MAKMNCQYLECCSYDLYLPVSFTSVQERTTNGIADERNNIDHNRSLFLYSREEMFPLKLENSQYIATATLLKVRTATSRDSVRSAPGHIIIKKYAISILSLSIR